MTPQSEQETLGRGRGHGGVTLLTLGDITNLWGKEGGGARPPKGRPVLAEVSEIHELLLTLSCTLPLINIVRKRA